MLDKINGNTCNFCKKTDKEVSLLIAAPDGCLICDECIGLCAQVVFDKYKFREKE